MLSSCGLSAPRPGDATEGEAYAGRPAAAAASCGHDRDVVRIPTGVRHAALHLFVREAAADPPLARVAHDRRRYPGADARAAPTRREGARPGRGAPRSRSRPARAPRPRRPPRPPHESRTARSPRPTPGKMKTLFAWPITCRVPSCTTSANGLPVATSARPSVQAIASSGRALRLARGVRQRQHDRPLRRAAPSRATISSREGAGLRRGADQHGRLDARGSRPRVAAAVARRGRSARQRARGQRELALVRLVDRRGRRAAGPCCRSSAIARRTSSGDGPGRAHRGRAAAARCRCRPRPRPRNTHALLADRLLS